MSGFNYKCGKCGHSVRIDLPTMDAMNEEIARLRRKIMELEAKVERNDLSTLMGIMGMGDEK